MTAREYRRVRGYVRANAAFMSAFDNAHKLPPLALEQARQREAHAWSRLPERAKQSIQNPMQ